MRIFACNFKFKYSPLSGKLLGLCLLGFCCFASNFGSAQTPRYDQTREGHLVFHPIKTDAAGKIMPWYSEDLGKAYSHTLKLVWEFWYNMRSDQNGLPYYMNHQVWRPINDPRGMGGDQLAMALSSFQLLYQYTGDERIRENMKFIADYYLTHSLSQPTAAWPNLPFPYNTLVYSGQFDGDMTEGVGVTQPDKAGSFGFELVQLYYLTHRKQWNTTYNHRYLQAAIAIANTLAAKMTVGTNEESPLPFKVNAYTGLVANLKNNEGDGKIIGKSGYTSNWVGTLRLFEELIKLKQGDVTRYQKAHSTLLNWMKNYPLKTNKWGPFFEDIEGWSDTQINAVTFARYMLENPRTFPNWKQEVKGIFDWVYTKLGNKDWEKYGVIVVNEQTAYQTPGNSHSARQAATELLYAQLSKDESRVENAIRTLNWATYMVDTDGKNNYPRDEVWLTDGYGDYIRHYLRAMAARPALAPANETHILHSTEPLTQVDYAPNLNKTLGADVPLDQVSKVSLYYRCYSKAAIQTIRMPSKPSAVKVGNSWINELDQLNQEGYTWSALDQGGVLTVKHTSESSICIYR